MCRDVYAGVVMIAHQKLIRDAGWHKHDLLGDWWKDINTDIKNAVVKPTTRGAAIAHMIKPYPKRTDNELPLTALDGFRRD